MNLDHALAYDQIVGIASHERPDLRRVAPGNPDGSYLVQTREGRTGIVSKRDAVQRPAGI